jgi:hypothetical protein
MTRRLPPPWRAEKFSGGYVVRDSNGFAVTYVYGRSTEAEAVEAKQMTMDEARRVASNRVLPHAKLTGVAHDLAHKEQPARRGLNSLPLV